MLVIPIASRLYQRIKDLATTRRMIFVTGIPGVGKSLLIQQIALLANEAGREVHLLKYNLARQPFETELNTAKYPEIEGFTDPAIRKAVGLWARNAVLEWHNTHAEPRHLLIGELPLMGNRLVELVEAFNDDAEALLSSERAHFVIPVPSWEVREVIEQKRALTLSDPRNELESLDAPPNVLEAMWQEVNSLAREIGLTKTRPQTPYNPYIYGGVYEALLQHRHSENLLINEVLRPTRSVYDLEVFSAVLQPTAEEADRFMKRVETSFTKKELEQVVNTWHASITDDPRIPDPGPELRLPLPQMLPSMLEGSALTAEQHAALQSICALPLDACPEEMLPLIDRALEALQPEQLDAPVSSEVHKFDIYDSYFNVTRSDEEGERLFLVGLLQSYRNVMADLQSASDSLTVIELPMLRIALETVLNLFE